MTRTTALALLVAGASAGTEWRTPSDHLVQTPCETLVSHPQKRVFRRRSRRAHTHPYNRNVTKTYTQTYKLPSHTILFS